MLSHNQDSVRGNNSYIGDSLLHVEVLEVNDRLVAEVSVAKLRHEIDILYAGGVGDSCSPDPQSGLLRVVLVDLDLFLLDYVAGIAGKEELAVLSVSDEIGLSWDLDGLADSLAHLDLGNRSGVDVNFEDAGIIAGEVREAVLDVGDASNDLRLLERDDLQSCLQLSFDLLVGDLGLKVLPVSLVGSLVGDFEVGLVGELFFKCEVVVLHCFVLFIIAL